MQIQGGRIRLNLDNFSIYIHIRKQIFYMWNPLQILNEINQIVAVYKLCKAQNFSDESSSDPNLNLNPPCLSYFLFYLGDFWI